MCVVPVIPSMMTRHCIVSCAYRILEAAKRFMVRWHEDEAQLSRQRRASAVGGVKGNGGRGGNRRSGRKPDQGNAGRGGDSRNRRETAEDESRIEMADRVARHQADY